MFLSENEEREGPSPRLVRRAVCRSGGSRGASSAVRSGSPQDRGPRRRVKGGQGRDEVRCPDSDRGPLLARPTEETPRQSPRAHNSIIHSPSSNSLQFSSVTTRTSLRRPWVQGAPQSNSTSTATGTTRLPEFAMSAARPPLRNRGGPHPRRPASHFRPRGIICSCARPRAGHERTRAHVQRTLNAPEEALFQLVEYGGKRDYP